MPVTNVYPPSEGQAKLDKTFLLLQQQQQQVLSNKAHLA